MSGNHRSRGDLEQDPGLRELEVNVRVTTGGMQTLCNDPGSMNPAVIPLPTVTFQFRMRRHGALRRPGRPLIVAENRRTVTLIGKRS